MYDPGTGGLIPTITPGHSPGIGLPYDPDQARHLLEKAGYPDGQGFPDMKIPWHRKSGEIEFFQEQWLSNLNVEVAIDDTNKWEDVDDWVYKGNLRYMGGRGTSTPTLRVGSGFYCPNGVMIDLRSLSWRLGDRSPRVIGSAFFNAPKSS
jgi:ABC-type transport system substrate-binding protein